MRLPLLRRFEADRDPVERWWARFTRATGGPHEAPVSDRPIAGGSVLAQPSTHVADVGAVLVELCWDAGTGWQPWLELARPYDSAELRLLRLRDALLLPRSGLVMAAPLVAVRETRPDWADMLEPLPGAAGPVAAEAPVVALDALRPGRVLDEPVLSLCHVYGHGYGHWFADAVPPLLAADDERTAGRGLLLPPLLPWQRRTLELLGVPPRTVLEVDDATIGCRDVVCHSFGGKRHALRPGPMLAEVYRRLRASSPLDPAAPALIFVSRRALGSWRDFANEAEVEAAMTAHGFTVLHPETMTLDEQIAAFSAARVVVGAHGSAFANAGFAPPGCLLVTVVPEGMRHDWAYGLARQLGHHLVVLVAPREDDTELEFFAPFRYRIPAEVVVERTLAAMAEVGG